MRGIFYGLQMMACAERLLARGALCVREQRGFIYYSHTHTHTVVTSRANKEHIGVCVCVSLECLHWVK